MAQPTGNHVVHVPLIVGGAGVVIIPETTEVLDAGTLQALSDVSPDGEQFTFAALTPALSDLDVGDVMVAGPSSAAPAGFLRLVTGVQQAGGEVVVATTGATLEDAITDGSFAISRQLTAADLQSAQFIDGVSLVESRDGAAAEGFNIDIDAVVYDADGNDNTTNDQLTAEGSIELNPGFDFDIDIDGKKLQQLEVILRTEEVAELELKSTIAQPIDVEIKIGQLNFANIVVLVGYVPVVIVVDMPIYLQVNAELGVVVSFGKVTQTANIEAGVRYDRPDWDLVADFDNDFDVDGPDIVVEAELRGLIHPPLRLRLYGVAGPYVAAQPYMEMEAEFPLSDPHLSWDLYGGLTVPVGVEVELLGHSLADYEGNAIEYRVLLLSSNDPPFMPSNPTPPDGAAGQPLTLQLGWQGGDPEGDEVKYDVYLAAGDPTPGSRVCDDIGVTTCATPPLTAGTTYYWRVTARDDDGLETEGPVWGFTTAGSGNQPPFLPSNPSPAHGSIGQPTDLQLSWSGGDPDGDPLTYTVRFEANDESPDTVICTGIAAAACDPGPLAPDTTYHWQVQVNDSAGHIVYGAIWRFDTGTSGGEIATIDVALIIDSSGSMVSNDPANLRKAAAKTFIGAMVSGDLLSVVDFDDNVYVPFALQQLVADRSAPLAAVDTIDSSGGTNIGLGLQAGYDQLLGSPNANPKAAILLTDGQGDYNGQAQLYSAKGWPVFTIGLSSSADEALLREIASATGGQFFSLNDPNQLIQVYVAIQAAVTGSDIVINSSFTMQQNQSVSLPATIDAHQNTANFVTNWPGSRVDTTLIDPNGRVITPATAQSDPAVYHAKGSTYEIYRISAPEAGQWSVELYGAELAPGGEEVTVQVSQRDNELPGGAWEELGSNSAGGGGVSNTAADSGRPSITHSGNDLYLAWAETRNQQNDIYVRRWNGTTWAEVGGGSAAAGGISNTAGISQAPWIEAAPDGSIYLAWHEAVGAGYEIYLRRWNGSAWIEVGGSASGGGISDTATISQWPSVAIDSQGKVYVAWEEVTASDKEIFLRRWNGSAWEEVAGSATGGGISNNTGDSGRPFLLVDSNDVPIVGWSDGSSGDTEIFVRRLAGGSWTEIGGSASGGGVSNNTGDSRPPVLGVDSTGALFVTWPDNSGGEFNIFVRRWDGNNWIEVGSGSASGGGISGTNEVSLAPHIAIAPDDTVYVIWYERLGTNTDILIRRWTGTFWGEVGVGSASGGGISNTFGASSLPTVTITAANMPVVAWADNSAGNYEIYVRAWR